MSMDLSLGEELDNEEYYTELLGQDADTQDWNNVPSETYIEAILSQFTTEQLLLELLNREALREADKAFFKTNIY